MNVLKQLHCSWKQPFTRTETKMVNYFVQYERVNHIIHPPINYTHEDEIDRMIFQGIRSEIEKIIGIDQLNIDTKEAVLYSEYSNTTRALFSNLAIGDDFRDLQVRGNFYTPIINLKTRIWFSDRKNEDVSSYILPLLPHSIEIEHQGNIPTLIQSDFMSREESNNVLQRDFEN